LYLKKIAKSYIKFKSADIAQDTTISRRDQNHTKFQTRRSNTVCEDESQNSVQCTALHKASSDEMQTMEPKSHHSEQLENGAALSGGGGALHALIEL
jgi:uncharacterized protein YqfB (UPF0267 family)